MDALRLLLQGAIVKKFKNSGLQKVYDTLLELAADKTSELYDTDGSRHTDSDVRCTFWNGFDGINVKHRVAPGTMVYAAYQAGREFRRQGGAS